ncbi:MAG: VCBS repeat-containing protein [Bacteroidota bacterium]
MKKTFFLVLISIPVFLFSQFGNERILIETLGTKYDVEYADLDNDGDQDVITAARRGLVWYENLLEQDQFSEQILIDKGFFIDLAIGDLDGDNDEDLVAISYQDIFTKGRDIRASIILYENIGINGFKPHLLIADESEYSFYQELNLFDKDKDGDLEILVGKKDISAPRSTDTLLIMDNLGNLSFENPALFYTDESFEYDFSIYFPYDYDKINLLDLDGDNALDLVIGVGSFYSSYYDSKIVAYLSSLDQFIQIHEPESPRVGFFNFSGMDYDNDGDIDLSVITQSNAFWLENDGSGLNYVEHILMDSTRIYRNLGSTLFYNIIESSDFNQDGW